MEAGAADTTSLVSTLLLGGHSLQVEVEEGWRRRHRAQGYGVNSTSKAVLPTVQYGLLKGIRNGCAQKFQARVTTPNGPNSRDIHAQKASTTWKLAQPFSHER